MSLTISLAEQSGSHLCLIVRLTDHEGLRSRRSNSRQGQRSWNDFRWLEAGLGQCAQRCEPLGLTLWLSHESAAEKYSRPIARYKPNAGSTLRQPKQVLLDYHGIIPRPPLMSSWAGRDTWAISTWSTKSDFLVEFIFSDSNQLLQSAMWAYYVEELML